MICSRLFIIYHLFEDLEQSIFMCSLYHYSIENSKLMVPLFSGHYTLIGHIF